MIAARLNFGKRKFILKCYWKYENAVEVLTQFRREFQTGPPKRVPITREAFPVLFLPMWGWSVSIVFRNASHGRSKHLASHSSLIPVAVFVLQLRFSYFQ